ncbi:MAG: hypothetical protein PHH96_09050, partial [Smithellaceae bacterium]|nr:hypothetical protein [Smithellaceae bacterium]
MLPKVKIFSSQPGVLSSLDIIPNLSEIQLNSYDWFIREGLRELFQSISPVKDYTGKELELYFVDYYFD